MSTTSLRTRVQNAAVALVATLVVLVGIEVVMRLALSDDEMHALPAFGASVEDRHRTAWLERRQRRLGEAKRTLAFRWDVHDPLLGWRPRPHITRRHMLAGSFDVMVRTNAAGLRGTREFAVAKPPGTSRIGVFGCSQTFAGTIAEGENYADRLDAALPPTMDVLNFGVHGYGTDQMLLRFERDGLAYDLDVAVLGFAAYHMERNAVAFRFYAKPRFTLKDGALTLGGVPTPDPVALAALDGPARAAPSDHSIFLRWLWNRILDGRVRALQDADSAGWPVTKALIERFAATAREHDVTFVLLNLESVAAPIEDRLAALTADLGVLYVNAGPTFRERKAQGRSLRHHGDFHWTSEGHRVIADMLHRALCEQALIPCDLAGEP